MPLTDLTLDGLLDYRPVRRVPADFDEFWSGTLAEAAKHDLGATFEPVATGLSLVTVYDVTYRGYGGEQVRAWLTVPAGATGPLPCVVEYPGYGGGRGLPHDHLLYAAAGYAHLLMDLRGQGSGWRSGATPDREPEGGNPQYPGVMTRGVLDPAKYYYRRLITDAVRAVEVARSHPLVEPARVAVTGVSQGGGLTLAVAALVPDLVAVAADVPFLCDYRRGADIATTGPYLELAKYLAVNRDRIATVFDTLSYFDGVNFAERAVCPALFSVALMDTTCPPSTVYGAYHLYGGPRQIEVYEFNGHEGGESFQIGARLAYLADHLKPNTP